MLMSRSTMPFATYWTAALDNFRSLGVDAAVLKSLKEKSRV